MVLPVGPRIDQLDRRKIAVADEKILGAKRRAMRQIERELSDRHEALARGRCGWSTPGAVALARRQRLRRRLVARHVPEPSPRNRRPPK